MGDSTLVSTEDEDLTIELLACDLVALLTHLKWKDVAVIGYSMGGVFHDFTTYVLYTITYVLLQESSRSKCCSSLTIHILR